ncbi:MAG TPA: twin-arginine translocation signal domain-containing protein [Xanthobacteraceae bacterium]|nr:twin-arginine translocation signal domain-containing protein [Xanthobacteraceae bacterium]
MTNRSSRLSRRGFLERSVCGAALAGAAVLPAWAQARGKVSKASARYQDRPNGSQQCSGCTHFRGGTCEIVEGQISPNGWCRHFERKGGGGGGGKSSGGSGRSSGGGGGGGSGY